MCTGFTTFSLAFDLFGGYSVWGGFACVVGLVSYCVLLGSSFVVLFCCFFIVICVCWCWPYYVALFWLRAWELVPWFVDLWIMFGFVFWCCDCCLWLLLVVVMVGCGILCFGCLRLL